MLKFHEGSRILDYISLIAQAAVEAGKAAGQEDVVLTDVHIRTLKVYLNDLTDYMDSITEVTE